MRETVIECVGASWVTVEACLKLILRGTPERKDDVDAEVILEEGEITASSFQSSLDPHLLLFQLLRFRQTLVGVDRSQLSYRL